MATTNAIAATSDANNEGVVATETQRQSTLLVEPPKPASKEPKEAVDYQKVADKLGNELGELRAQNKELMSRLDQIQNPPPQAEPVPSFTEQPEEYIKRIVQDAITTQVAPNLDKIASYQTYQQTKDFQDALGGLHGDWTDVVSKEEFQSWVKASPARVRLYGDAQAFDLDSANELLTRYKQDAAKMNAEKNSALGAADMISGGAALDSGKRVFRASEIQALMQEDKEGYDRWLRNEGHLAYREGRVIRDI